MSDKMKPITDSVSKPSAKLDPRHITKSVDKPSARISSSNGSGKKTK